MALVQATWHNIPEDGIHQKNKINKEVNSKTIFIFYYKFPDVYFEQTA
jgi:hypothetical protein